MPVRELSLKNNTLSGLLPPIWGTAASNLTSLRLSENLITGGALHLKARQERYRGTRAQDCDACVPTLAWRLLRFSSRGVCFVTSFEGSAHGQ